VNRLRLPQSLTLRLLILFISSALIILIVLTSLFSYGLRTEWRNNVGPHLTQYVRYVRTDLGDPPSIARADELAESLPVDIHIFNNGVHVHSTNNIRIVPAEMKFRPVDRLSSRSSPRRKKTADHRSGKPPALLELFQSQHRTIVKIPLPQYELYVELDRQLGSRGRSKLHLWLLPIALIALLSGLYWLLRRQLSPIHDIKSGVAKMTDGDLSHRIPVRGQDDLSLLAQSVNGLSAQIQHLLDAKRELLLSVSHELRSPITRTHLAAELLPESNNRTRILEDVRLLDKLIEALMESERLQSDHVTLNLKPINFYDIVNDCVEGVQSEWKSDIADLNVLLADDADTKLFGDEVRLHLLCRNILNNAVLHGKSKTSQPPQASINIRITVDEQFIECIFADEGNGVAADDLESLTEPFFRPDRSRTHGTGGVGLGLSLARLIAEAHGGSLTLDSEPAVKPGLRVKVRLSRNSHPSSASL